MEAALSLEGKDSPVSKRLSAAEMLRHFTKLELRQAEEIAADVRSYLRGHTAAEVSQRIGIPQTLVRKLASEDIGHLVDVIAWQRQQRRAEQ